MKTKLRILLVTVVALTLAAVTAVCFHSLEEIHYLKSFFPRSLSVEDAYYATQIELVKVVIIAIPLVLLICVCLFFLNRRDKT